MANLNLKVVIGASGKTQISTALPQPTGGQGNVVGQPPVGNIYAQQIIFQNQGAASMWVGDATTTDTNGLLLAAAADIPVATPINCGTFLSDWWVVGTAGQVLFVLFIQ